MMNVADFMKSSIQQLTEMYSKESFPKSVEFLNT